ncbi:MAG: hypothetical protein JWR26_576 [Pedosphaera sp.]|nr:hypothetical protein [Pedosphaera sp.]
MNTKNSSWRVRERTGDGDRNFDRMYRINRMKTEPLTGGNGENGVWRGGLSRNAGGARVFAHGHCAEWKREPRRAKPRAARGPCGLPPCTRLLLGAKGVRLPRFVPLWPALPHRYSFLENGKRFPTGGGDGAHGHHKDKKFGQDVRIYRIEMDEDAGVSTRAPEGNLTAENTESTEKQG